MPKAEIRPVTTGKDWRLFFQLPRSIYRSDPLWVPPLLSEQRKLLHPSKNPFFLHGEIMAWLALRDGAPQGRILAFTDPLHNRHHGDQTGFFGFFESADQQDTAGALLEEASRWLRHKGLKLMRGPVNLSLANEAGVLIRGFEHPPVIQMNHNPPYYQSLLENWQMRKAHDLIAFRLTAGQIEAHPGLYQRLDHIFERVLAQNHISLRKLNMKQLPSEIGILTRLYNEVLANNWGFVPASREEMDFMGESLKLVADPDLVLFAETGGETVGCAMALPDVNQALRHLNGRLFPFGFLKWLYLKPRINGFRLILLGVTGQYRKKGIDAALISLLIREGLKKGYRSAELSWISENNANLISILQKMKAEPYKVYRVYDKPT